MIKNEITEKVIDYCLKVHKTLGTGPERQVEIPVAYGTISMDLGFRADLVIEDKIIVELKSAENLLPVHKKQLLTYLKLTGMKVGLLINFNTELMKDGIIRVANGI